ncbi:hypothetical protein RD110_19395 [Rhodoferax koreense]|uniref:Tat pathway signal protein n=1 Tax=Rhodoferax koreensis TaxID=1842727 RepID=A0A1P8JZD2_9BURK|nr:DUF1501 domain-containing protein [Rhodoferax koreense]APW39108.1 hypothetical protein RD110_19395 [Rhodoferax koreense]
MKRRHLLGSLAVLPFGTYAGELMAAPAARSRLLLVFLRGAYDAASLLVPTSSPFYLEARPDIAIRRPGPESDTALPLDADWGLHPALRASVYPMFQKGEASFIPFAGTEDLSRSHFESQDSLELGQPLQARRNFRSGFLNRLATVVQGAQPMAFTDRLPLVLQGQVEVPNTSLASLAKPAVDARQAAIISAMYQGTPLAAPVASGFALRDEVNREIGAEMLAASRGAISARGFELEAQRIARLMRERFNLGFVDVGGWDTHVNQGGASGYLASRLDQLGRGLAAFAEAMGPAWRDTTVVVVSEFGRTFRQNGNRGTDHGHGSVYWVLGGGLRSNGDGAGRIAGEQVRVEAATLFQQRDYPVLNECRAVLAGLFQRQFGLNPGQLQQVFDGVAPRDLQLI